MEGRLRILLMLGVLATVLAACEPAKPPEPETRAPEAKTPSTVEVYVKRDGAILMNGEPVDEAEFVRRLDSFAALPTQPVITVNVDRDTRYSDLARVFKQLQKRGMAKLGVIGGT
jgi:biopolymer transport protein ExbD